MGLNMEKRVVLNMKNPLVSLLVLITCLIMPVYAADEVNESNTSEPAKTERPKINFPISQQRLFDQDLTKYTQAGEVAWLGDKDNRFLTLWSEQTTAKPKGTSWIFADTDTSANNPHLIQTVRLNLNDKGFNTYSISPLSSQIKREDIEAQLLVQIQVLETKITNQIGKRLLILQGENATSVINVLANNKEIKADAVVLLGAHNANPAMMEQLAKNIAAIQIPVLDLYQTNDGSNVQYFVKERRVVAKRSLKQNYRQTEIIGLASQPATQQATSQTIYGWLKSLGWYN